MRARLQTHIGRRVEGPEADIEGVAAEAIDARRGRKAARVRTSTAMLSTIG